MKVLVLVVLGLAAVLRAPVCWAASPQGTPPIDVTQTMFSGTVVKNDAVWGLGTCTVTGGSATVTCSPAPVSFPVPATGYTVLLVADDAGTTGGGTSGQRIPFVGNVMAASVSGGVLTMTLGTFLGKPTFGNDNHGERDSPSPSD